MIKIALLQEVKKEKIKKEKIERLSIGKQNIILAQDANKEKLKDYQEVLPDVSTDLIGELSTLWVLLIILGSIIFNIIFTAIYYLTIFR